MFLLNRYFEVMSQAIERHGGEVDKFLGDGIMALFGVSPARGLAAAMRCWPRGPCLLPSTASTPNSPLP